MCEDHHGAESILLLWGGRCRQGAHSSEMGPGGERFSSSLLKAFLWQNSLQVLAEDIFFFVCKPCCFQATNLSLLTFLLPQLPAAKVMLVAGLREPRKSHFSTSLPRAPPPRQMPVPNYTVRVKTTPCLPAQCEGKCCVGKATFPLVLSSPHSCLAFP